LNETVKLVIPELQIANTSFINSLGIENYYRIELNKLISHAEQNTKVYGRLSDYILHSLVNVNSELLPSGLNIFSFKDWMLILTTIISFLCIILIIILAYKLKNLALIVLTLQSVRAQIPRILIYSTTTPLSVVKFTNTTSEDFPNIYLHTWLPTTILILLVLILVIIYLIIKSRKRNFETTIYLEIGNRSHRHRLIWCKLPDTAQFYKFEVHSLENSINLTNHILYYTLAIDIPTLSISHANLNFLTTLTKDHYITPYLGRILMRILQSDYYLALRVVDSRDSTMVILRNSFTEAVDQNRLYPDLSLIS